MAGLKAQAKRLKERTALALPERHISMSNALARGAQGLSLSQKRIVALALAKTDSVSMSDAIGGNMNGWKIRIHAHEYVESFDVDPNTAYEQMKDGARSLLKCLWRTVKEGPKGPVITEGQWLHLCEYSKGEGRIDVTFHPKVAPHLLALRTRFTSYKLKQAAALRSVYAWRLFECLQSWKSKGVWSVDVKEFGRIMEAPASCLADFGRLKARVIDPALKELAAKEGFLIELETERAGRKVTGLVFKFRPDPQGKLAL